MKRLLFSFILLSILMSGCSSLGHLVKEPVVFYYVHEDYTQNMGQVIVSEIREASGHRDDLSYLFALYSMGPSNEELIAPFPRNTVILPIEHTGESIVLNVSDNIMHYTDAEYTLASTCIALTCMEITNVQSVTVVCEDRSVTIEKDQLLLQSSIVQNQQEEQT